MKIPVYQESRVLIEWVRQSLTEFAKLCKWLKLIELYNKSFLRDYEEFEVENWRGVGFLVELNGSQLILWSMKYKYHICEMNHEVFFKISEIIVHFKHFSWFFAIFRQSSTRSETRNVVYIDAIPKLARNSRVQPFFRRLTSFQLQILHILGEMIFCTSPDDFESNS